MPDFSPISNSVKQQLFTQLCEQLEDVVTILDSSFRYLFVNKSFEQIIGYQASYIIGRPLGVYAADFLSFEEQDILQDIAKHLEADGLYKNNFSINTRYGQIIEFKTTMYKVYVDQTVYYVVISRDISDEPVDKKQVNHLLNYNELTDLPNRKIFLSQVSELLLETYQEVIVVRLNIDRFRSLSNMLGLKAVNTLIMDFVTRINQLKLENLRCFSHFGGDDFALLFECHDANMVRNQLDKLMQEFERPFSISNDGSNDTTIYYHISVGVSYFPNDDSQFSNLMTKAEKALDYVKQNGGDDICWFSPAVDETSKNKILLTAELRIAISENQFFPYYQPKVDLDTGIITGFEALVRWQHPTRGLLNSSEFIDAIVSNKLSFDMFCQMATQIAEQLSVWQRLGFCQHICINTDAAELSDSRFFDVIYNLLKDYDIDTHQLHIEVTESSLIQRHDTVERQLNCLKELGICLALDDFGTGFASLSYLQEYPFDFIKVDKSFISKIVSDAKQRAIVKAILELSDALDMKVIAEGIENEQQRDMLLGMGYEYGQGYLFSKPVTAEVATKMLMQQYNPK